jgi:hypothetical protein
VKTCTPDGETVNRLRDYLNIHNSDEVSDEDILRHTEGTFLRAKIELAGDIKSTWLVLQILWIMDKLENLLQNIIKKFQGKQ